MKSLCRTITLITLLVKCQAIIDGVDDSIDLPVIEESPSERYYRTEENMQPLDWKKEHNSGVFLSEFLNRLINDYYVGKRDKSSGTNSFPTSDSGFHGDVFTDGFGTFHPVKRLAQSVKSRGLYDWDCAGQHVKGSDKTFRNCFPEITEKELNYTTKDGAIDRENNVARLSKLPLLLKYLYTLQSTNKRDPVYMEGFKRISGLRLRNPSIYKKAPNRHVGVFNGDAFHSNLGTFDTLRKR